jgi:hypothetical protein
VLRKTVAGNAGVDIEDESARLYLGPTLERDLALAQLDDHHPVDPAHQRFIHRPPVRAALYARAWPARPRGTFGFGFWNDPYSTTGAVQTGRHCLGFYAAGGAGPDWKARVWTGGQSHETALTGLDLAEWTRYEIEWLAERVVLWAGGVARFRARVALPGPLGFAMWMSNRVEVPEEVEPGPGRCSIDPAQWLEVKSLKIE